MNKEENSLNNSNLRLNLKEKTNQNPSVAMSRKERGITLIALVVTIVVLIILATISINAVMGENGLIRRAEVAGEHQANAKAEDGEALDNLNDKIGQELGEPQDVNIEEAKNNEMLTAKTNSKLIIGDDTVWIPAGFKVHVDSADVVDEGIVITDGTNEFVWVPVSEESFDLMFKPEEALNPALTLSGGTGVTSSYYSNLRKRSGDNYTIATVANGKYSSTSTIREPELVTEVYNSETKANEDGADLNEEYVRQAGFTSTAAMAQAFVDDYTNMRASIEKYDGFYIGRYELTGTVESPTVKAGTVLTASSSQAGNWYGLYKACRDVKKNNKYVTSTMIWGCQWDETMNWLKNTKFKNNPDAVDSNSSTWGNYKDVSVKASDGTTEIKASGTSTKLETGITTYTMANKIYDLAGNCFDWTQEAYRTVSRVIRGGYYNNSASDYPASDRYNYGPSGSSSYSSARATLYVNP